MRIQTDHGIEISRLRNTPMKEFVLRIPDACYKQEPATWEKYFEALQQIINRMSVGACKYHYDKASTIEADSQQECYLTFTFQRIALYDDSVSASLCDCGSPKKHKVNCFTKRATLNTGNTENLLDAVNGLLLEAIFPKHLKAHFRSQDTTESPGRAYKE